MAFSSPPGGAPNYEVAPPTTADTGLLSLGPGPWDGSSAGHFTGPGLGTALAINVPSGFNGFLLDLQRNGVVMFGVAGDGTVTAGTINGVVGTFPSGVTTSFLYHNTISGVYLSVNTAGLIALNNGAVANIPLAVKGPAGQTGDLFQAQSSTAAVLSGTRADGLVYSTLRGLATMVKAGTPVDADWAVAPPDGTIVGDSAGAKLWIRLGGTWKGVVVA
jgi:hypothetical protein